MQVRSGHSITFLHPFFIISSLEGIQKFLTCKAYPKKKRKKRLVSCLGEFVYGLFSWHQFIKTVLRDSYQGIVFQFCEVRRICLWVVLSTPIYQNCVERLLPRYCFSILWGKWTDYPPQEDLHKFGYRPQKDLPKFGYRSKRKVEKKHCLLHGWNPQCCVH